ncbi:HAMP domain-containing protein [bacterium SCSIO 12827]|nr:HAMP domain-containing protein [bacterium SCSIO 12827]
MRIRSLTTQTIIMVILGLTTAYLIGLFHYSRDRLDALIHLSLRTTAQTFAHVTHTVASSNTAWRFDIVNTLNEPHLRASLSGDPIFSDEPYRSPYDQVFREHIKREAHSNEMANVRINMVERPPVSASLHRDTISEWFLHVLRTVYRLPVHLNVRMSVPLNSGGWLNIAYVIPEFPTELWSPSLTTVGVMTFSIILISMWVVRRMLSPLDVFARAARRFASDIHAPPMPDKGAAEVREVAAAFNEMQNQIRKMIQSRTEMMGALSHDLRTPLSLIKLRGEALPSSEEKTRLLSSVSEMETIISTTLGLARQAFDLEERQDIDLGALIHAICDDASDMSNDITATQLSGQTVVHGQPVALRRAFSNLIDNGLRYGHRVRVFLERVDTRIFVHIEDNGPGIPDAEMERVFEPFYRCDRSRSENSEGTGLGLSLAKTIIENHGGTVTLCNREPSGLAATVTLPC